MRTLILLLAMWPFHHHKTPVPAAKPVSTITMDQMLPSPQDDPTETDTDFVFTSTMGPVSIHCDKLSDGEYIYIGDDRAWGVANSCRVAFQKWNDAPQPRPLPVA